MQKKKRKPIALVLILAGIVFLAIQAVQYQRNNDIPPLLPRARRLLPLPGARPEHWWITAREVLLLDDAAPSGSGFVRHNIETGQRTELPKLSAFFQKTKGQPTTLRVSTDGLKALWETGDHQTAVAMLDGSRHLTAPRQGPALSLWFQDSAHWVDLLLQDDRYAFSQKHRLAEGAPPDIALPIAFAVPATGTADLSGMTTTVDGNLLVHMREPNKPLANTLVVMTGFSANPMAAKQLTFAAPHVNHGGSLIFDPESLHMAWVLKVHRPLQQFLIDCGLASAFSPQYQTALWVADQQKQSTTLLGALESRRDDQAEDPVRVRFLPGGKALSFVYQNALWVVPLP